jgi:hypothetical protein
MLKQLDFDVACVAEHKNFVEWAARSKDLICKGPPVGRPSLVVAVCVVHGSA